MSVSSTVLLHAFLADGRLDEATLATAARLLREGRLVAIPTETVYGLGANALDPKAVARIFEAKGRPGFNPLIVHVTDAKAAAALASHWPETASRLASAFWPGPLTLVVPRGPSIPDLVTGGLPAVALRAPSHPVARRLLLAAGIPIAAPSANRSGAVSPTTAAHVLASLGGRIDAVLDAGPCAVGIESTVLDLTGARPRLLRPGGVDPLAIEAIIGPIERGPTVLDSGARASPGMLSRHYAPDAVTKLVDLSALRSTIAGLPADARIGVIVRAQTAPDDLRIAGWERLGNDPAAYARELYAALHRLEAAGVTHVVLERPPDAPGWEAVLDRLTRAAG